MRKQITIIITLILMSLVMCSPVLAYTSSSPTYYKPWMGCVTNVSSYLNIRSNNSSSSSTVGKLYADDLIHIVGNDSTGSWYRVQYDTTGNNFGYVSKSYISVASYYKYYVAVDSTIGANFRAGRSVSSTILCTIPYGRSVPYHTAASAEGYYWFSGVWGDTKGCLREDVVDNG